ncbi:major capsid protein [Mycobacterium Phage Nergal]|nr:major capsid protein [Mycobacterium Phage Nergal]
MTIPYPLASPTVNGNDVTVDRMLKEPTRITRYLADESLLNYFAHRIFPTVGAPSGGAVLYTQLTENDVFPDPSRPDIQNIEPGAEFPIVGFTRPTPRTAQVEKFGGRFFVTDEARDRNDATQMQQGSRKLAATINRQIHNRALAELNAEFTALGAKAQTVASVGWQTVQTNGNDADTNQQWPAADFAKVQLVADQAELGVTFNTWIVNPLDATNFRLVYGRNWREVLAENNTEFVVTNRQTAGEAWVIEDSQVGECRLEQPLSTVTYRDDENEQTWVQSGVRPVFYVTNPYSVLKVTGLGA